MSKALGRTGNVVFALLVAAGLTLGARSALAAPNTSECPYNAPAGQFGIACRVSNDCDAFCPDPDAPNICAGGCCTCFL